MHTVRIRRKRKYEVVQAMIDLVQRGYEVVYGPQEIKSVGSLFKRGRHNKMEFSRGTYSTHWVAQLRRADEYAKTGND